MAERLKRGTVNTICRGSSPLKAFLVFNLYRLKILSEHVEIGKQSFLKKKWK